MLHASVHATCTMDTSSCHVILQPGGLRGRPPILRSGKNPISRSPTYRHSFRHSQDIMQRIIDEYSAQVKPGWWKSSWRVKTIFEAENIDLYRYCKNQLERLRMEKARLKLERLHLGKDRLRKLREYEAEYMKICQYCTDKLKMLRKPREVQDKSSECPQNATDSDLPRMKRRETNTSTHHPSMVIPTSDSAVINSDGLPRSNQAKETSTAFSTAHSVVFMPLESSYQESSDVSLHDPPISSDRHSHPVSDPGVSIPRVLEILHYTVDSSPPQVERDDINPPIQRPHDAVFTLDSAVINVVELPRPNRIRGNSSAPSVVPTTPSAVLSASSVVPSMIIVRIHNMPFKFFIRMNSPTNVIDSYCRDLRSVYDDRIVITNIRRRYMAIHFHYHSPKIFHPIE